MITPNFSDYRQDESIDFLKRFTMRIGEIDLEPYHVQNDYNSLSSFATLAMNAYRTSNEVITTAEISEADMKRDSIEISLLSAVNNACSHYKTEIKEAGMRILNCMEKYGKRIHIANYVAETAILTGLCTDLKTIPGLIEDIARCGLTETVNDLQVANNEFDALYNKRLDQKEAHDKIKFAEYLSNAVKSCRELYSLVEAGSKFMRDIDFSPLVTKMEMIATEYNNIVSRRLATPDTSESPSSEPTVKE